MTKPSEIYCVIYELSSDTHTTTTLKHWIDADITLYAKRQLRSRDVLLLSVHKSQARAEAEVQRLEEAKQTHV